MENYNQLFMYPEIVKEGVTFDVVHCDIEKIFTEQRLQSFEKQIKQHHELYPSIPVNAQFWEKIAATSMEAIEWVPNSHNTNEDLKTEHEGLKKPSLKSGIIKNNTLKFSSHRMSKYKTLDDMIEFLDTRTYDSFLFLARNKEFNNKYLICYMSSKLWKYSEFDWCPKIGVRENTKGSQTGWVGVSKDGNVSVNINFKMSNQLWVDVDLSLVTIVKEIFI